MPSWSCRCPTSDMAHFLVNANVRKAGKSYNTDVEEFRVEATSLHAAMGKAARKVHAQMKGVRLEKMTVIATRL